MSQALRCSRLRATALRMCCEDVLQMRLGLAEVARAAQPADTDGLGMGAFDAGSLRVRERECVGVFAEARGP